MFAASGFSTITCIPRGAQFYSCEVVVNRAVVDHYFGVRLVKHSGKVGIKERFVDVTAQTVVTAYIIVFLVDSYNFEIAAAYARSDIV